MVQARVSSGPGGEERDEAQQLVAQPDDALQAGALQAQVLAEDGGLLLGQLADLHLDARRERLDQGRPVRDPARDAGHDRGARRGMSASPMLSSDEHRLLGQEAEAADALGVVLGQLQVADRPPRREGRQDAAPGPPAPARSPRAPRACRGGRWCAASRPASRPRSGRRARTPAPAARCPATGRPTRRGAAPTGRRRRAPRGAARPRCAAGPAGRPGCPRAVAPSAASGGAGRST